MMQYHHWLFLRRLIQTYPFWVHASSQQFLIFSRFFLFQQLRWLNLILTFSEKAKETICSTKSMSKVCFIYNCSHYQPYLNLKQCQRFFPPMSDKNKTKNLISVLFRSIEFYFLSLIKFLTNGKYSWKLSGRTNGSHTSRYFIVLKLKCVASLVKLFVILVSDLYSMRRFNKRGRWVIFFKRNSST